MNFTSMLKNLADRGASDVHIHAGLPPMARINGRLIPVSDSKITSEFTEKLLELMCDGPKLERFRSTHQIDLAYSAAGVGRFRVNLFRQRGSVSAVMRIINADSSVLQVVTLPEDVLNHFRDQEKGLVLVTGPTGSGKSTTLARIIDEINIVHDKMIVTVEDPIEFLHTSKKSAVVQREIGMDAVSFADSLVAAMRQDPDVILIGEIRDHATAVAAVRAAQTGHMVFSTLHTQDSVRTINRILDLFPPHERATARILFAESLVGIVAQRLLPTADGKGRVTSMEILKANLRIRDLIKDEERTGEIYEAIRDSKLDGMQLMDDHLAELYSQGVIDFETGMNAATSAQAFKMAATQTDVASGRSPLATQFS